MGLEVFINMILPRFRRLLLTVLALLAAAAPAMAAGPPPVQVATPPAVQPATPPESEPATQPKNEVVVFGGFSFLDVGRSQDQQFNLPDWPGGVGLPPGFTIPGWEPPFAVSVRGRTSLGGSGVFGARYSRYLKSRLAVEADLSVAPGHHQKTSGAVCLSGGHCIGGGDVEGFMGSLASMGPRGWFAGPGGRFDVPGGGFEMALRGQSVTAWQYGAGLAYDLMKGNVRPLVTLGAGAVTWSGAQQTATNFELRLGAGLKVLFGKLGGRLDVVDHVVFDQYLTGRTENDVQVTAGFLVRFR